MAAVFEPIMMMPRMPFGEAMRMTLMGTAERITAQKALDIGLVSEVVAADDLRSHVLELAAIIASYPTAAVQASVRTGWAAREMTPRTATDLGSVFLQLGTTTDALQAGQEAFTTARRRDPRFR
jgi:enoyl-CoA hydratase/carnithine racemase